MDDTLQLERARAEVVRKYADLAAPEVVLARFDELVARFDGHPIRTFVPVLAERELRSLLVAQRSVSERDAAT